MKDAFLFDVKKDGTLDMQFGASFLKMMKVFHCVIASATYNFQKDVAHLTLHMPLVKKLNVILRKESSETQGTKRSKNII